MALKNRNQFPIGGYQFFNAPTNWRADPHVGFDAVVSQIIAHRKANPRFAQTTDRVAVENELEAYTEARMRSIKGGEAYLIEGAPPLDPSFPMPPRQRRIVGDAVGAIANEASKIKVGIGIIKSWLGSGLEPVAQEIADKRASTCLNCQFNQEPTALQSIEGAAGSLLHSIVEAKSQMKLKTALDDKLKTCSICSCKCSVKIWVPIDEVWSNTPPEMIEKFDSGCWILERRS